MQVRVLFPALLVEEFDSNAGRLSAPDSTGEPLMPRTPDTSPVAHTGMGAWDHPWGGLGHRAGLRHFENGLENRMGRWWPAVGRGGLESTVQPADSRSEPRPGVYSAAA